MQHTDLHPGNILVRVRPSGADKEGEEDAAANIDDILLRPIAKGQARAQLQLVRAAPCVLRSTTECARMPEGSCALHTQHGIKVLIVHRNQCRAACDLQALSISPKVLPYRAATFPAGLVRPRVVMLSAKLLGVAAAA